MNIRRITAALLVAAPAVTAAPGTHAQAARRAVKIQVDGVLQKPVDPAPYQDMATKRVMVPVSFVSEALGHKVGWDNATKTVTIDGVWAHVEASRVVTNIETKKSAELAAPSTRDAATDRLLVPVSFLAETPGYDVAWDDKTATVNILTGKAVKAGMFDPAAPFDYKKVNPEWVVPGYDPAVHGKLVEQTVSDQSSAERKYAVLNTDVQGLAAQYFFSNLRFIKEGGKYYVSGKMPIVPYKEGYRPDFAFVLYLEGNGSDTQVFVGAEDYVETVISKTKPPYLPSLRPGAYTADGSFKVEVPASCAKYDAGGEDRYTRLLLYAVVGTGEAETAPLASWWDRGMAEDVPVDKYHMKSGDYKIPGGKAGMVLWK